MCFIYIYIYLFFKESFCKQIEREGAAPRVARAIAVRRLVLVPLACWRVPQPVCPLRGTASCGVHIGCLRHHHHLCVHTAVLRVPIDQIQARLAPSASRAARPRLFIYPWPISHTSHLEFGPPFHKLSRIPQR